MAKIENVHLLEEVFGNLPSFHDAEVLRIVLNREKSGGILPTLEALIYVFEMTSEIKDGKYVCKNHSLVTFQFREIDQLVLEGFNNQNALQGLSFTDISNHQLEWLKFEVGIDGIFGLDAHFKCRSISVLSIEPYSH